MLKPTRLISASCIVLSALCCLVFSTYAAESPSDIPSAADKKVTFHTDVLPILSRHCAACHTGSETAGGLSIKSRTSMLQGGDSGPAIIVGNSADSLLVKLVAGIDPDRKMPQDGEPLSERQVAMLRAWIDQGADWDADVVLQRATTRRPLGLTPPRHVNAIDAVLQPYFAEHNVDTSQLVDDRTFLRRVSLDLIGLLPTPAEQTAFANDDNPRKRSAVVNRLLNRRHDYAAHWMTFWNDALRNEYRGAGYIDGGRIQITSWLYESLLTNKPFDEFIRELIVPVPGSEGFLHGIKWRGTVNASQRREMQSAQTISQVFFGVNLKCASCHDSFINDWKLDEAYGFANVFAEKAIETHRCEKPDGDTVQPKFIYPELGQIDPALPRADRLKQLAELMLKPENGRLSQTMVNRIWDKMLGRGIVRTVDNMDDEPFHTELLDLLAYQFQESGYDLKSVMRQICASHTYQLPSVDPGGESDSDTTFRGPVVRRMTAEQFIDGIATITDQWPEPTDSMKKRDGRGQGGQLSDVEEVLKRHKLIGADEPLAPVRTVFHDLASLSRSLGRPPREQVATTRESQATTLQAIELMNGAALDKMLKSGAEAIVKSEKAATSPSPNEIVDALYQRTLGRSATDDERTLGLELIGTNPTVGGIQDLMWVLVMLPEFQLIY